MERFSRVAPWRAVCSARGMPYATSLRDRVFALVQEVLRLQTDICRQGRPFEHMANQLFRAASSIGAMLEEGDVSNSRRDMGAKHAIALREAKEARYRLRLLIGANVQRERLEPIDREVNEFVAMLTTSVRKLRAK